MKRYLLFACDSYYPNGGWIDFIIDVESIEEGLERLQKVLCDFWHIVDTQSLQIVKSGRRE